MEIYINVDKQYIQNQIVNLITKNKEKKQILTEKIYQLEQESKVLFEYSTHRSYLFRDLKFKESNQRKLLRKEILQELISLNIPIDENDMSLGDGGCKPPFINKKNYFQIIGLPGSGKTYIANIISKKYGAYLIDSDFAKRKFPEYEQYTCSSSLLHEEANEIAHSLKTNSVFDYCLRHEYSMVIPRIGYLYEGLSETLKLVKKNGYHIYLILIDISIAESIKSCYERYYKYGRYMPLIKILNDCGSLPKLNYNLIKNHNYISGYALINTNLSRNNSIIERFCFE